MPPRFRGLWRHPDFVRLWAGETVSVFGSLVGQLALQFTAVIFLHARPAEVALLAAAQLVPGFAAGLFAGVWVDRLRRRPIMIIADLGRAAALGSIPLSAVFDALTLGQLYLVGLVTSVLTVFFDTAYQAYLPSLVRADQLVEGNSKLAASASVAEVGGFGISGWLVQAFSGPGAILIDSLSFVGSAFFIGRIRASEPLPGDGHGRTSVAREAREGLRLVLHDPVLRALAGASAIMDFAGRIITVVLLLYLVR
ncbi:MAG: MFS transporter [Chloroflexota bacterium]